MKEKNLFFKRAILALCLMAACWTPARAEVLLGDVNGDGKRNITDVTALISAVLNEDFSGIIVANADMTGDDVVNISDLTMMIGCLMNDDWPDEPTQEEGYWVDLGLSSGTLWATRNIGASSPEDYGDHFAWGETEPKDYFFWTNYIWNVGGAYCSLIRYNTDPFFGEVDDRTELLLQDDAAYVNWGSSWRIPTKTQLEELRDQCAWQYTEKNGINGFLFTGPNGKTLFLPAAGYCDVASIYGVGYNGYYWSRTLNSGDPKEAYYLDCHYNYDLIHVCRDGGISIRPVRASQN